MMVEGKVIRKHPGEMTPEERTEYDADLAEMQQEMREFKINAFDSLMSALRTPPEHLVHTGHKTLEDMIMYRVRDDQKRVEKIPKKFLKKYPD